MSDVEDLKAQLEALKKENEALKDRDSAKPALKVSAKGGVSLYGLGRFPVTLYKEQWLKLLDQTDDIRKFIDAHSAELKTKG